MLLTTKVQIIINIILKIDIRRLDIKFVTVVLEC